MEQHQDSAQGSHAHFRNQGQHGSLELSTSIKGPRKQLEEGLAGDLSQLSSPLLRNTPLERVKDALHLSPASYFLRCKWETENLRHPVSTVCHISVWWSGKCDHISSMTDFFKRKYPTQHAPFGEDESKHNTIILINGKGGTMVNVLSLIFFYVISRDE